ncbi:hypothetical protein G1H11_00230 [Phytoactinopolyspora alkaliphila]|uniref:PucR family transcriptional regulator n=1 Tax=Phytoactinopolyspora alkaliphila TaxID=1783498 RepID=A0A6N9YFS8_9ACTN|nr:helix-turn-helix domain-containing protein [Phytoactinopolyspora alkaliphila]NED93739.1 hypothetical protein [Phytoactinopolyspora alkaliphila]
MPTAESATSVAEILIFDLLGEYEVIGGRDGLTREVGSVTVCARARDLEALPARSLAIFERAHLSVDDVSVDLALRVASDRQLAGIVVERCSGRVPEATLRLADRFAVPLILVDGLDATSAVAAVDRHLRGPRLAGLQMVDVVLARLRRAPHTTKGLIGAVRAAVRLPAAITDAQGQVVDGDRDVADERMRSKLADRLGKPGPPAVTTLFQNGCTLVCHPATVSQDVPGNLWLIVRLPIPGRSMIEGVSRVLTIAAMAFTSWISTSSLYSERDSRYRGLVLGEMLEQGDELAPGTIQRATALGWRLFGWHIAVHVDVDVGDGRSPDGRMLSAFPLLHGVLAKSGMPPGAIQWTGGWVSWLTFDAEPDDAELPRLVRRLGHAMRTVGGERPGVTLASGVGRPHFGPAGLADSLREARHASLLARARGELGSVESFGSMSVDRLLSGWQRSEPLLLATSSVLAPLREADPNGDLVRTLKVYLDHESSTTATANVLRLHRNTVLQRIDRIKALLPLDLAQPNDRLVAHLASRVAFEGDQP